MLELNRRNFLKAAGAAATVETLLGSRTHLLAEAQSEPAKPVAANDHIQIALIGAGGQGQGDTKVALQVPGVKLVAVADCYDGRLEHSKELWGDDIFTTRDYSQILERKDIDAVIIGTPDHWHKQVAVDAMKAGKDVYCEKPMIHLYADGPQMIEAARANNRIIQIGSQRVSSVIYAKAKELLAAGAIGQLNMVTARWDRNSSIGAWNYTVPLDASTETCDWPQFLGTAPQIPFNAEQFFQWRKWKAYGSGVAGDLFVHLFSGTHFITGAHGPTRAMATGGLRFWKDGRDVPDVMLGLFDYPEGFNLSLRVNFVDGGEENEGLIFTGSEGTMEIAGNSVIVSRMPLREGAGLHDRNLHRCDAEADCGRVLGKNIRAPTPWGRRSWDTKDTWRHGIQRQLRSLQEFLRLRSIAPAGGGRCRVRLPRCRSCSAQQSQLRARHCRPLGPRSDEDCFRDSLGLVTHD